MSRHAASGQFDAMSVPRRQDGLTYMEVLVATVLIALLLVPGLQALNSGLQSTAVQSSLEEEQAILQGKLADLLAIPFATLDAAAQAAGGPTTPTSLSDTVTLSDGRTLSRQVFLSRYDGDNADADGDPYSGTDAGLLWVRVTLLGTALAQETLTAQ
jgi:type II secretory pathway component PulJ